MDLKDALEQAIDALLQRKTWSNEEFQKDVDAAFVLLEFKRGLGDSSR